jgi:hypothetical protein
MDSIESASAFVGVDRAATPLADGREGGGPNPTARTLRPQKRESYPKGVIHTRFVKQTRDWPQATEPPYFCGPVPTLET